MSEQEAKLRAWVRDLRELLEVLETKVVTIVPPPSRPAILGTVARVNAAADVFIIQLCSDAPHDDIATAAANLTGAAGELQDVVDAWMDE